MIEANIATIIRNFSVTNNPLILRNPDIPQAQQSPANYKIMGVCEIP